MHLVLMFKTSFSSKKASTPMFLEMPKPKRANSATFVELSAFNCEKRWKKATNAHKWRLRCYQKWFYSRSYQSSLFYKAKFNPATHFQIIMGIGTLNLSILCKDKLCSIFHSEKYISFVWKNIRLIMQRKLIWFLLVFRTKCFFCEHAYFVTNKSI